MNFTYKSLLSLDSIHTFLKQYERIIAIKKMLGNTDLDDTPKMIDAVVFIETHKWKPPETKYGQDRLLYFKKGESWKHVCEYKHEIINEIQKLK